MRGEVRPFEPIAEMIMVVVVCVCWCGVCNNGVISVIHCFSCVGYRSRVWRPADERRGSAGGDVLSDERRAGVLWRGCTEKETLKGERASVECAVPVVVVIGSKRSKSPEE